MNILEGFFSLATPWFFKVMLKLGFGVTIFTGVQTLLDTATADIQNGFTSLPPQFLQMASTLNLDICINILISAATIKFTLNKLL